MNIIEFMESDELTPGSFEGDSWEPAKAVLSGAFAIPMDRARLDLFSKLAGGRKPPRERVMELWWLAGRRSSKTNNAANIGTYMATIGAELFGLLDNLKPGEVGVVNIIAVDRSQAKVAFNYLAGMFEASPILAAMVKKRGADFIELTNRVVIEVNTNNFKSVRGRTTICTIFDEACFFADEHSASPDIELYRACIPALATTGGLMVGISSPWAKRGLMYQKWREHYGQDSDILVVQGPTELFNPTIDRRIIRQAYLEDPEAARSEWGGCFRENVSGFIDREVVEQAMRQNPLELPYQAGTRYIGVADPAGGGADEFTMAIGHVEDGITVVDVLRAQRGTPAAIVAEYADLFKSYGATRIVSDRFAGSWPADEFRKHGIECEQSAKPKSQLYADSLSRFNSGQVELPPDPVLLTQFCNLERRTARGGRDSIDHPPGKGHHDDRSNAVALLLDVASGGKRSGAGILLPRRWRSAHA
ncbi:hypothetical protein [uncultured Halomonas sp.]|uniref:hypothetical protein n=1 Tax=uncultured Halomonas sp. TaxID=173971 RepID=UPI002627D880|nr:hypothetical protein [uncultured Halomonas sp.]